MLVDSPVLLFDGFCPGCNAIADSAMRHDRDEVLMFASLQSDVGQRMAAEYGFEIDGAAVLVDQGRAWPKLTKVARLGLLINRGPWRFARLLRWVPRLVGDWIYDLAADNRSRLFGRNDKCRIPTEEEKRRFLE